MFDHLGIRASDREASERFYETVLRTLGIEKDSSDEDLAFVVGVGRAACARVLPLYRKLAERGQVELCCSPYYPPILPLLCDIETGRRSRRALGYHDQPMPDAVSGTLIEAAERIWTASQEHMRRAFDERERARDEALRVALAERDEALAAYQQSSQEYPGS